MFRTNERFKLEKQNFSVGSTIRIGKTETLLVVPSHGYKVVDLLNLQTFELLEGIDVDDCNWLTEDEVRRLVDNCIRFTAFSDCIFSAEGLKK